MHCVEFQKRGLLHAHILIRYERDCLTPSDIDTAVSAELPSNENDRNIVKFHMLHKHPPNNSNTLPEYCTKKGKYMTCRFRYPHTLNTTTYINEEGRVVYRRRNQGDEFVVPYNVQY